MKNILTLANVVVKQSLRGVDGLDNERRAIDDRMRALSAAQDVLTRGQEKGAEIRAVIERALAPHISDAGRIEIDGPSLMLDSHQVLGLTLAVHELGTNASKHGALSTDAGAVAVTWQVNGSEFRFRWIEADGPPVRAPDRTGFGYTILEKTVGAYFQGSSELTFHEDGVEFVIIGSLA